MEKRKKAAQTVDETDLKMRRNREFLWISSKQKRIYLKEQESCLALYFSVFDDILQYIRQMVERGYVIG